MDRSVAYHLSVTLAFNSQSVRILEVIGVGISQKASSVLKFESKKKSDPFKPLSKLDDGGESEHAVARLMATMNRVETLRD